MKFQENSPLATLLDGLRTLETSRQSIDFFNQWLVENFCLFGCTYAILHSGLGHGVDWVSWSPETLFTSRAHEVDFNELALKFQKTDSPTIMTQSEMAQINDETAEWAERNRIISTMVLPIQFKKDTIGLFLMYRNDDQPLFGKEDLGIAEQVARLLSNLLKWQIRLEAAEQKINELDQMLRASLSMTESLNLEEVLNSILNTALKMLPQANDAHIFLYKDEKLYFGAALFRDGSAGRAWAEPRPNGLTYQVARSGKMIVVEDICRHPLFEDTPWDWCGSIVGIPIIRDQRVLGVMTLAKLITGIFDKNEIETLNRLANQAGHMIQNVNLYAEISRQAFTDPLTNLPNRRSFEWEAQKVLELSSRYNRKFSIAMLDLNGFKRINDTYGHATGDNSLRLLAQCMNDSVRKTDFLARFGGDEFIVLFPESTQEQARETVELLLERVKACQVPVQPQKFESLSISYGLASYPHDSVQLNELIQLADKQLYMAKGNILSAAI
ncbi:MAG: hypothetical protein BGO78_11885 [Chloroflexi bacterium 44-23]|nr:MAG: hypothetical protein BGO78_11885 [Chloroflexi bacterium 44-23]